VCVCVCVCVLTKLNLPDMKLGGETPQKLICLWLHYTVICIPLFKEYRYMQDQMAFCQHPAMHF